MKSAVVFRSEAEAERVLGPGKIPAAGETPAATARNPEPETRNRLSAPECPKHPGEPQIGCNPAGKRAGQYLGACKVCMQERVANKKPRRGSKEQMTAAVARDLKKRVPGSGFRVSGKAATEARNPEPKTRNLASKPPEHPCPEHPGRERHRDKVDRLLPFCRECYAERGKGNLKPGRGCRPGNIVLSFPEKYAALREWLDADAEEYVRSPAESVLYYLKLAMRGA